MEFDESEIYETLGMTPPETEQEPKEEPIQDPENSSGEPQENEAAPKSEPEVEQPREPETPGDGEKEAEGGEDVILSEAERPSRHLPNGERQAAIQNAVAEAIARERERTQAEWKEFFSRAGLRNSLNGAAITSREEFEAWHQSYEAEKLSRELKEGKLTPEALDAAVRNALRRGVSPVGPVQDGPDAQSPSEWGSADQRQGSGDRSAGAGQVTQADIDRELAEIHRMDGSVNGLEDILKLETGPAFRDAVRRGHSFLDAFKIANFDRLQQQRQAEAAHRAAQAARNNAASKEHLKASTSKGSSSTPVPGDVMEMYRMMMPDASEADIMAHYNKALKDMRG